MNAIVVQRRKKVSSFLYFHCSFPCNETQKVAQTCGYANQFISSISTFTWTFLPAQTPEWNMHHSKK